MSPFLKKIFWQLDWTMFIYIFVLAKPSLNSYSEKQNVWIQLFLIKILGMRRSCVLTNTFSLFWFLVGSGSRWSILKDKDRECVCVCCNNDLLYLSRPAGKTSSESQTLTSCEASLPPAELLLSPDADGRAIMSLHVSSCVSVRFFATTVKYVMKQWTDVAEVFRRYFWRTSMSGFSQWVIDTTQVLF